MSFMFNRGALGLQNGSIDWDVDDIRARLSRTTENAIDEDATSMTGLGLSATETALSGNTGPTENTTDDRIGYDYDDFSFVSVAAGPECDKYIVYKFVTDDAGSTPIAVIDLNPPRTPNGGDINVTVPASGAFYTQQ